MQFETCSSPDAFSRHAHVQLQFRDVTIVHGLCFFFKDLWEEKSLDEKGEEGVVPSSKPHPQMRDSDEKKDFASARGGAIRATQCPWTSAS